MDGGANIFSSAILGTGFQMVVIKVKTYTIEAPTIRTIAGVTRQTISGVVRVKSTE